MKRKIVKNLLLTLGLTLTCSYTAGLMAFAEEADDILEIISDGATEVIDGDGSELYEELDAIAETENIDKALDPITPSDFLIQNVSDYITLGDVDHLSAVQYTYAITDEMIQNEIQMDLMNNAEEVDVERPSKEGDTVYFEMTATPEGETPSEAEDSYVTLGEAEFGEEFDEKLTGVSAGDSLSFSITFGDEIWEESWVGNTVNFDITVASVTELVLPEYNDEYVTSYTDYSSTEEYEDSIRESMEEEYSDSGYSEALESLFHAAIDASELKGYPDDLYDSCKEEILSFYSMFAGTTDEQAIYEMFGVSEEDLKGDILDSVNRRLLISALCEEKGLELTESEYTDFVTEYAGYYGYPSPYDFEADNGRDLIVWSLYESKAGDYLYDHAEITEEVKEDTEEFIDLDDVEAETE